MIDGYRGNVNSSICFIFISMVFIIFAAEDGTWWVGNKRFHSRFTLGERVTLFSKNDHSLDILFFFLLSFFFSLLKYKIIPIITSLSYRERYNLSSLYLLNIYIYIVENNETKKFIVSGTIRNSFRDHRVRFVIRSVTRGLSSHSQGLCRYFAGGTRHDDESSR